MLLPIYVTGASQFYKLSKPLNTLVHTLH